jgi:hypothetical protein
VIGVLTAFVTYSVSLCYDAPRESQLEGCWGEKKREYVEIGEDIEVDDLSSEATGMTMESLREHDGFTERRDRILYVLAGSVLLASVSIMIIFRSMISSDHCPLTTFHLSHMSLPSHLSHLSHPSPLFQSIQWLDQ